MSTPLSLDINEGSNLKGYLAIDSTVDGRSHGGLRMAPNLSPGLITQLARTMTLKYGFVGIPSGGAKAGIVADPEMLQEKKREILSSFGQAIKPFLYNSYYSNKRLS